MGFKTIYSNTLNLVTKNEHLEHDLIPYFYSNFVLDTSGAMNINHYQSFSISSIDNPVYSTILSMGSPLSFIFLAIF